MQVSKGLHIVYNRTSSEFETFDFEGKPVDDDALYKVAIQRYAFISMKTKYDLDQLEVLSNGPQRTLCTSDYDVIEEYLSTRNNLDSVVEGRMIIK